MFEVQGSLRVLFFSFPDHSFIWRSSPVYGFLVTLAGKTIIAPGLRLFVCVWVHILCISVFVYVGLWTRGVTGSHPRRGLFLTPHRCPCGCLQENERPSFFVNTWHIHIQYTFSVTLLNTHILSNCQLLWHTAHYQYRCTYQVNMSNIFTWIRVS